ncbi:MAG: thiamine-phosphate kinase [Gammaproteobacteria bacterium]|nr:thiamine-phosphate kinase [Gammaproteobacteria bacterium]
MLEFDLIARYFQNLTPVSESIIVGIGDDAAVTQVPCGKQLVTAVDGLVAGVHFPLDTKPEDIAYKALAVNISDLAAMGACPAWFTLSLTLPDADETWLKKFSQGLAAAAKQYRISLIGGDTSQGPLTLSIQVMGWVDEGQALKRSAAKVGDTVYLSGHIGDAGLGLKMKLNPNELTQTPSCLQALNRPQAQLDFSMALKNYIAACIDVSDGLIADMNHICEASQVGAELMYEQIPFSSAVQAYIKNTQDVLMPLTAGDDYQLCFSVHEENIQDFEQQCQQLAYPVFPIGKIVASKGLRLLDAQGQEMQLQQHGYQHFS